MTKLIPLGSIEHGVRRAIGILGEDGTREALAKWLKVDRSASLIRKCADPDDTRHHLQFRYAVALDIACKETAQSAPLLEVHQNLLEQELGNTGTRRGSDEVELVRAVVVLQAALGDLANIVDKSLSDDSSAGSKLSNGERHKIYASIDEIEKRAEAIKQIVSAYSPD